MTHPPKIKIWLASSRLEVCRKRAAGFSPGRSNTHHSCSALPSRRMKRSFVGPGGEESPKPPNKNPLAPTIVKEWPERGLGTLAAFLFFATHTDFVHASLEAGSLSAGMVDSIGLELSWSWWVRVWCFWGVFELFRGDNYWCVASWNLFSVPLGWVLRSAFWFIKCNKKLHKKKK